MLALSSPKNLKFVPHLVPLILSGEKRVTWRLFDEKNLSVGDELILAHNDGTEFARARALSVREKRLGDIMAEDEVGHEPFRGAEERLAAYKGYYGERVTEDVVVKMVGFEVIKTI